MKKKILIMICLIALIVSIAGVSAAEDVNQTVDNDADDLVGVYLIDENLIGSVYNGTSELQKIIDDADEGSTIMLEEDYKLNVMGSNSAININKPLTIEGNGHFIDASGITRIFEVDSSSLTLNNITFKHASGGVVHSLGNVIVSNCNFVSSGGAIYSEGNVNVSNCNFVSSGGAIYSEANVGASNCSFVDCSAGQGGAIYSNGDINLDACSFLNCNGWDNAAVYSMGDIIVSDSSFKNSCSHDWGAAICSYGDVTVIGSKFENCENEESVGGAIYSEGNVNAIDSIFLNCFSYSYGTAIYCENNIGVDNCSFIGNGASGGGGVIYSSGNLNVSNSIFTKNSIDGNGGAIYSSGNLIIVESIFDENYADGSGGAIYTIGECSIVNCSFAANSASSGGGAVYSSGDLTVLDSDFAANSASSGGAVYSSGDLTVLDSDFAENSASSGGAVYSSVNSTILNSNFINNNAYNGGAIYFTNALNVLNSSFVKNSANANRGRGGAVYSEGNGNFADCNFLECSASDCGAIYCKESADVNIANSIFDGNSPNDFDSGVVDTVNVTVSSHMDVSLNNTLLYKSEAIQINVDFDAGVTGNVTVSINGKNEIFELTNNSLSIIKSNFAAGTYDVVVSYAGDDSFLPAKKTARFKVVYYSFKDLQASIYDSYHPLIQNPTLDLTEDYAYIDYIDENPYVSIPGDIKIYGHGHSLDGNNASSIFRIEDSKVILDSINFVNGFNENGGSAVNFDNSEVSISNSNFVNNNVKNHDGGVIYGGSGTLVLSGCDFSGCSANSGGAIFCTCDVKLSDCDFSGCSAKNYGGAIFCTADVTVSGCDFGGCSANSGGAIYCMGDVNLSDCDFGGCSANSGGAIYSTDDVIVIKCNFSDCSASGVGGAIYCRDFLNIDASNFVDNSAYGGGAVYSSGLLEVVNSKFANNVALETWSEKYDGGAIYCDGNASVSDCSFADCSASGVGGAIYCAGYLNVGASNFEDNFANYGGAVYSSGLLEVVNSKFVNNIASEGWLYGHDGGAIYCDGNASVSDCSFADCSASREGGAIYSSGDSTVLNSNFTRCSADFGGAIYSNENIGIVNCSFLDCSANGGAIYYRNKGNVSKSRFVSSSISGDSCNFTVDDCSFVGSSISAGSCNFTVDGCSFVGSSISGDSCNFTVDDCSFVGSSISAGSCNFTVDGCSFTDVFGAYAVIRSESSSLNVKNSTFEDNLCGVSGAIYSKGDLTVVNSNFTDNTAHSEYPEARCGAIYSIGNLTVVNSNFANNLIYKNGHYDDLGNIYSQGNVSVSNCTFIVSPIGGSAIYNKLGNVRVADSTFANSSLTAIVNSGNVDVIRSRFVNNSAGISGSDVSIEDSSFTGCSGNIVSCADISIINSTFANNSLGHYVSVLNSNGDNVNIVDSTFADNSLDYDASVININSATANIINSTFENNYIRYGYSAVVDARGCNLSVFDSSFSNNKLCAIDSYNYGYLEVFNCSFINNVNMYQDTVGGAICAGKAVVEDSTFINNVASFGGAIGGSISIDVINCSFTENSAPYSSERAYGGAIYSYGHLNVWDCSFEGNNAEYSGAIYAKSSLNVEGCNFTDNVASIDGGAIYSEGSLNVSGCSFTDNSAWYGGAIFSDGDFTVSDSSFVNNTASGNYWSEGHGGAIYSTTSENAKIINTTFINNSPDDFYPHDIYTENTTKSSHIILNMVKNAWLPSEDIRIDIILDEGATGEVIVYINGIEETLTLTDSSASLVKSDLGVGSYDVLVKYEGDSNFAPSEKSTSFEVGGSFADLRQIIDDADDGEVIELDRNYFFMYPIDELAEIEIRKDIRINGNGHSIIGAGVKRLFNIENANVALDNITFEQGESWNGGAIYSKDSNLTVINSNFINNYADKGSAIYSYRGNLEVKDSNFVNNSQDAAAIFIEGGKYDIVNSTFINNLDVTFEKLNIRLSVYTEGDYTIVYPNSAVVVILTDRIGNYTVSINGKFYKVIEMATDEYKLILDDLTPDYYKVEVLFEGDEEYEKKSSSTSFEIKFSSPITVDLTNAVVVGEDEIIQVFLPDDATGKVTLYLNGDWYGSKDVNNSEVEFILSDLTFNNYEVRLDYNGDEKHVSNTTEVEFKVLEPDTLYIYADDISTLEDLAVDVYFAGNSPGVVVVSIDSTEYRLQLVGGYAGLVVSGLAEGEYEINAVLENTTYEETSTVTVHQASFSDLQRLIDDLNDGDTLYLTGDIIYQDDERFMSIDKAITIDGNGHTIDGAHESIIFEIACDNVVLDNINFINGYGDWWMDGGGAILAYDYSLTVVNCSFTHCSSEESSGGAIYSRGGDLTVIDCSFVGNSAYYRGGAIYSSGNISVIGSNFEDNYVDDGDDALWAYALYAKIENCTFINNDYVLAKFSSDFYLNLNSSIVSAGESIEISAEFYDDITGNVTIRINDDERIVDIVNNQAVLVLSDLAEGTYDVEVTYYETEYWRGSYETSEFKVIEGSFITFKDLQKIINDANDGDTIYLTDYCIYDSSFGREIHIDKDITIIGNGNIIDGNHESRLFDIGDDTTVVLVNITFINANTYDNGAIYSAGDLSVINCIFENNSAEYGGAIYSAGVLTVNDCSFINNHAYRGAAIYSAGLLTVADSDFADNRADRDSGAIYSGGDSSVSDCSFINNRAGWNDGGAINNGGDLTIINCSFVDNYADDGGAIYSTGDLTVVNCSFVDNYADDDGGAVYSSRNIYVSGSTFENNSADYEGDAIWAYALYADIDNCTFVNNDYVLKKAPSYFNLDLNASVVSVGESVKISVNFNNDIAGTVTISVNGQKNTVDIVDNCAELVLSDLTEGTYDVEVIYYENEYYTSSSGSTKIRVIEGSFITFKDLQELIDDADYGDIIYLNDFCIYDESVDSGSIYIDKDITIIGNGNVIDGNQKQRIFYIDDGDVVLDNIVFTNAFEYQGAAIYSYGTLNVVNCTFVDNYADYQGGAIYSSRNIAVVNSRFEDNFAEYGDGDAIWAYALYADIENCTFINNDCFLAKFSSYFSLSLNSSVVKPGKSIEIYVEFYEDLIGNISICVNDDEHIVPIVNGGASLVVSDLAEGTYDITATYYENDYYYSSSQTDKLLVIGSPFITFKDLQKIINKAAAGDTIYLNEYCIYDKYVDSGYIRIDKDITIIGNGNIIDGNNNNRVFYISEDADVVLDNITFINGRSRGEGGAICNEGNLTVKNCNFENNLADIYTYWGVELSSSGGAIYSYGNLLVINSNFANNTATNVGGAICTKGDLTVENCNFENNLADIYSYREMTYSSSSGGAIYSYGNILVINSNFANNTATNVGGAIYARNVTAIDSSFINNAAARKPGAVYGDEFSFENCIFINNTPNDYKKEPSISASPSAYVYKLNDSIIIKVTVYNALGNVTLTLGDIKQTKKLFNETATFTLSNVDVGLYDVDIAYDGDEVYDVGHATVHLSVIDDSWATFKELQELIDNAADGDTIVLTKDYICNDTDNNQIKIKKDITIKGNGHIINGNKLYGSFYVESQNAVFDDLTFSDFSSRIISAPYREESANITFSNCLFENNDGGYTIISSGSADLTIINSDIINNTARSIIIDAGNIFVDNSRFINNSVTDISRVCTIGAENAVVTNSLFEDNTIGSIREDYLQVYDIYADNNLLVEGSTFKNNSTDMDDYIYARKDKTVSNCEFINKYNDKNTTSIKIVSQNIDVGQNLAVDVYLSQSATGNVTLTVNSKSYTQTLVSGHAKFTVSGLTAGSYDLLVKYSGDDNFNAAQNTSSVIVKGSPVISISAKDVQYGSNLVIDVSTAAAATGNVIIRVNGKDYSIALNKGKASLSVSNLVPDTYSISVNYAGDENFGPASANTTARVTKKSTSLTIMANDVTYGSDLVVNVALSQSINENVVVNIAGKDYTVALSNGKGKVSVVLAAGKYTITASYAGNENFTSASANKTVNVNKKSTTLTVTASDVSYGSDLIVDVTLSETVNDKVTVNVNNRKYTVDLTNGKGQLSVSGLAADKYTITASYAGNENFTSASASASANVNRVSSNITVTADDIFLGDVENIKIAGVGDETGKLNVTVSDDNGVITTKLVDISKEISIPISDLKEGDYSVLVTYAGDKNYLGTTASDSFKVSKRDAQIIIRAPTVRAGEDAVITVTIAYATGNVTIDVAGNETAMPLVNEKAVLTLSGLALGKYDVKVTYAGNDLLLPANASATFRVVEYIYSYKDLQELIDSTPAGSAITLTTDYIYNESVDSKSIKISKAITINGDGYAVDGLGNAGIFEITADNVVLDNLMLVNANAAKGAAAYITGSNVIVKNSIFDNNTADEGAGIYSEGLKTSIINSAFTNNRASSGAGAVLCGDDATIFKSNFTSNNANIGAGAIVYGLRGNVTESVFKDNIVREGSDGLLSLSLDDVLSAAISSYGAALIIYGDDSVVADSEFVGNNAPVGAGLVINADNCIVTGSTFTQNNAESGAGIVINGTNTTVSESEFTKNSAQEGAGILVQAKNTIVSDSSFEDNTAEIGTAILVEEEASLIIEETEVSDKPLTVAYVSSLEINVEPVTVGEDVTINVTVVSASLYPISGTVTIKVNNAEYKVDVENNSAVKVISGLAAGTYDVSAKYSGDVNHTASSAEGNFTVSKISDVNVTSEFDGIHAGDVPTITFNFPEDATGTLTATVNGKDYSATLSNGSATVTLDELAVGSYDVSAKYSGDDKYESINYTTSIDVISAIVIDAPELEKFYKGPERFVVNVADYKGNVIAGANVTININGMEYVRVTDDKGAASMAINLNSGKYNVTVSCNDAAVNTTITVKATVSGENVTKMFRNATQYYATFYDTSGKTLANHTAVEFNINGVFYTRYTNEKGVARMNINLNPGEYIITATNPENGEMYTNIITVLPTIVENYDLIKYYRNASQYSLRLLDDKGNPVGAGVDVRLNINGVFYTRTSNASGYVNMNINLNPGEYIITAEYNGLMASNTIKVLPTIETKDLSMKYKDGSKFEAKILDGQGKAYAGQTVTFNVNGVFYDRTTGDDGIARLAINLMAGKYIITSSFNGLNAANTITISS